jgi:hypothetical protein
MKNKILLLAFFFLIGDGAYSQPVKIPDAVKTAFATKYPNAENVKWGKENAKEYEAEFKMNSLSVSANFLIDGSWVESETVMPTADLPAAVKASILKKYPSAKFTMAEKLEMPGDKVLYEVFIKVNHKKKSIEINADGSFLKN